MTDRLIDPSRANLDMRKRLACQGTAFRLGQCKDTVCHRRVEPLQAIKFFNLGTVEVEKWQFESLDDSAHMSKNRQSYSSPQDVFAALRRSNILPYISALRDR